MKRDSSAKNSILGILLFNAAYLSAASYFSFSRANYEFVLYIGIVIVIGFILTFVHFRHGLTNAVLWCMSLWGFVHMSGGLVYIPESLPHASEHAVLYNLWIIPERFKFDQLVHAYGFGVTTWLVWIILKKVFLKTAQVQIKPTFGLLFLCAAVSMGLGSINEILEYIAVVTVPETNVGGYDNTLLDLIYNTVGAIITANIIYWKDRRRF